MNIVVAGKFDLDDNCIDSILHDGENTIYYCDNEKGDPDCLPQKVDAIICNWFFKYHDIRNFNNLKFIQLISSGYNGIDVEEANRMGIDIFNAEGVYSIPISEYIVGQILAWYKRFSFFYENQKAKNWEKNRTLMELFGKNILIVGTGNIGTETAKRLSLLTNNIYGCNRSSRNLSYYKNIYSLDRLTEIIGIMDIVIVTIASTRETEHLIDGSILSMMKEEALLVNVSRGNIIDEKALVKALRRKTIAGAILDVFEEEPLSETNPLWSCDNVIITPHNSFVSDKNNKRINDIIVENFIKWRER